MVTLSVRVKMVDIFVRVSWKSGASHKFKRARMLATTNHPACSNGLATVIGPKGHPIGPVDPIDSPIGPEYIGRLEVDKHGHTKREVREAIEELRATGYEVLD